jgi:triosephosphate isomerase (TIM)
MKPNNVVHALLWVTTSFFVVGEAGAFVSQQLASTTTRRVETTTCLFDHRKPFITGNWKLNPQTKQEAIQLATAIAESITKDSPPGDIGLFVPFPFIETVQKIAGDKFLVGAEVCRSLM